MKMPSTMAALSTRDGGWRPAQGENQPERADAETRGFLERPLHPTPLGKVLRVVLITAMVVAAVKVAWIIAFHLR
jgi:hypothetical protein